MGGRKGELVFDADRVLVWEDENVVEMELVVVVQHCECITATELDT